MGAGALGAGGFSWERWLLWGEDAGQSLVGLGRKGGHCCVVGRALCFHGDGATEELQQVRAGRYGGGPWQSLLPAGLQVSPIPRAGSGEGWRQAMPWQARVWRHQAGPLAGGVGRNSYASLSSGPKEQQEVSDLTTSCEG